MSAPNTAPASSNLLASLIGVLGMSGIAGVLVAAMVTPLIAVVGLTATNSIKLFDSLPDYLEIGALQQKTELYAKQGGQPVKFAEFYAQNREEVQLDQMSPYLAKAAVSTEDPRFYEHGGVDVISAARALLMSVVSDSGAGASTITMQYVRNVRIQAAESIADEAKSEAAYKEATETSIGRKLQEMRLAIGVDKAYSKEDILKGYLNIALFGGTVYGVESAAQYYWGKPASELTLSESASLIAMVQEPSKYRLDLEENIGPNTERRNYVLDRMLDEGAISQQDHDDAEATPVTTNITDPKHGCEMAEGNAEYFCNYVRNAFLNSPVFGETETDRQFNLSTKGYQVQTTLDLDLQGVANQAVHDNVPATIDGMDPGGAVSAVEPGTGRILAMAQNTEYNETNETPVPGQTSVNYNADADFGNSGGFQVGSTYKIFTLAEWLATGHSLNQSVNGATTSFNMSNFRNTCGGEDGGTWPVTNDGGEKIGSVTVLEATKRSLNTAYVAMAEQLDQCRIRDTAMALGAHRADGETNESNPAAILGTNQIAPLQMATALAGLANNGKSCSPIAIDSITLPDGTAQDVPQSTCQQAVPESVAAGVNMALQQVATGGTGAPSNPGTGIPMTGKTGTTDNSVQTWMVGATTKVGMAVWVGNASGNVPTDAVGIKTVRHNIFRATMGQAMSTYGGDAFPAADASATKPENVQVPELGGQTVEEAKATLEGLGFQQIIVGDQVNSDYPAGTVASTLPSANTTVSTDTAITIHPSKGPAAATEATIPDVAGMSATDATAALGGAGLSGGTVHTDQEKSDTVPAGQAIRTDPAAGSVVPTDSDIRLYISSGP